MKLLFVSNLYPPFYIGGYELVCHDVARAFRARGHDVCVLTSSYRAAEIPADSHDERGVYRLLRLRWDWDLPRPDGMSRLDHSTLAVHRHNVRVARRALDRLRPDLVLVWSGAQLGRGMLSALEERARVCYFLQDTWLARVLALQHSSQGDPRRLVWQTYRLALRVAGGVPRTVVAPDSSRLAFVSRALKAQYVRAGADVPRSWVVHNGIDPDLFPLRPQHILTRKATEPHRLLFAGQVAPEKGVRTLITAMREVKDTPGLEQTCLDVVGTLRSEAFAKELRELTAHLGLQDAVRFLPRVPRAAMPGLYQDHDLVVFTSEWEEPFAVTLLEAMATGVPVVSSTTGGSAELVRHGENALAFRAGDPRDLASKLTHMLLHPRQASRMGLQAAAHVREHFTMQRQVEKLEEFVFAGSTLPTPVPQL